MTHKLHCKIYTPYAHASGERPQLTAGSAVGCNKLNNVLSHVSGEAIIDTS